MGIYMKVKIPKRITILGRIFKVKFESHSVIFEKAGEPAVALMSWLDRTIYISSEMNEHEQALAFFHECTHALHYIYGLNQVLSYEMQELLCEGTANLIEDLAECIRKEAP